MSKTLFLKQKNIVSSPYEPSCSQGKTFQLLSKIEAYGSYALYDKVHEQLHSPQDLLAR